MDHLQALLFILVYTRTEHEMQLFANLRSTFILRFLVGDDQSRFIVFYF